MRQDHLVAFVVSFNFFQHFLFFRNNPVTNQKDDSASKKACSGPRNHSCESVIRELLLKQRDEEDPERQGNQSDKCTKPVERSRAGIFTDFDSPVFSILSLK